MVQRKCLACSLIHSHHIYINLHYCLLIHTSDVLAEIKNLYTTPTVLSGDNGWQPPMQNEVVDAAKGQSLLSNNMPGILMVSFNRFAHPGVSTHVGTKLCNRAEFPIVRPDCLNL